MAQYMLLIQHGDMPKPGSPQWQGLSADEQKAIKAIDETPGVTPGLWLDNPEQATTVRVQDGKSLTTEGPSVASKEALNGYLSSNRGSPRGDRASLACPRCPLRRCGGDLAHQEEPVIFEHLFHDE
jgi:hypothetical protein